MEAMKFNHEFPPCRLCEGRSLVGLGVLDKESTDG